jgi:hypothetical protein
MSNEWDEWRERQDLMGAFDPKHEMTKRAMSECDYKSTTKIHMLRKRGVSLCGRLSSSYEEGMDATDDASDVTCLVCKKILEE